MAENREKTANELDDKLWGHKWGYADTRFVINDDRSVTMLGSRYLLSGYRMYDFLPYVESVLGIQLDLSDRLSEVEDKPAPEPHRQEAFCRSLEQEFRSDQFSFEKADRVLHSHGQTTTDEVYRVLYSELDRVVDMVFWPESEKDARRIVELASQHGVCLVPYGGGTSVSSALRLPLDDERMFVSLDMRRMSAIEWIDRENMRACVQAGIIGSHLEAELAKEGLTSGHEPDSIELSTLGGWIATNASGMKKNRYGNIEDLVENITMITPTGVMEQLSAFPRASIGMQPQQLLFGSEGNLGLITKAVIKIHPLPEVKKYGSLVFPSMKQGIQCLHELAHTSFVPASIRLVDNIQLRFGQALKPPSEGVGALLDKLKKLYVFRVKGFDPDQVVAATIVMEGTRDEVAWQESNINSLAKKYGGIPGGSDNGRRGYMLTYAIAYIRDFLADYHIIGETFETSVPWSKIEQVCKAVEAKAAEQHRKFGLPGRHYVSYRITQVYHTGVCIYFMYGIYAKGVKNPDRVYGQIEHSLRQTIIDNGGSISHHHGVGKIRKDFMKDTLSEGSVEVLRRFKTSVDPKNVFGIRNNVFSK